MSFYASVGKMVVWYILRYKALIRIVTKNSGKLLPSYSTANLLEIFMNAPWKARDIYKYKLLAIYVN